MVKTSIRDDNSQENDGNVMTGCKFLDDKHLCGCSSSVGIYFKSTKAEEIFLENRGITGDELTSELDVSVGSSFDMIKLSHCNTAKFALNGYPVPNKLN